MAITEVTEDDDVGELEVYSCRVCERDDLQRDEMATSTARASVLLKSCVACWEVQQASRPGHAERERRAASRSALGHLEVEAAPDPRPAQALIGLLAIERERGVGFPEAWARSCEVALKQVRRPAERATWARAWEWLEPYAGSAFKRDGELPRLALSPGLLPADDPDDAAPADQSVLS